MVNPIQVIANTGHAATTQTLEIIPGRGDLGKPTRIKAFPNGRYLLQDPALKNAGPQKVRTQRVGKNLHVMLDGSVQPDLIVEGYFDEANLIDPNQGLMGRGPDGLMHAYIPSESTVSGLGVDGGAWVDQVLGTLPLAQGAWPAIATAGTVAGVGMGAMLGATLGTIAAAGRGSKTSSGAIEGVDTVKVNAAKAAADAASLAAQEASDAATAAHTAKAQLASAVAALGNPATPEQLAQVQAKQLLAQAAAAAATQKAAAATQAALAAHSAALAAKMADPAAMTAANTAAAAAQAAATALNEDVTHSQNTLDTHVADYAAAATTAAQAAQAAATAANTAKAELASAVAALGNPATPAQLADVEAKQLAAQTAATQAEQKAVAASEAATAAHNAAVAANQADPVSVAAANAAAQTAHQAGTDAGTAAVNSETTTDTSVAGYGTAAETAAQAAQAQVLGARAQRDLAASDYKRYEALLAQNFISAAELERRSATLKAAQSSLDQALSQAQSQANQAGYAKLMATTSGVNRFALMALPNSKPNTTAGKKPMTTFSTNRWASTW